MLIVDEDLGKLYLKTDIRAKRIIVRYREDAFHVTYPSEMSILSVKESIDKMKPDLLRLKDKSVHRNLLLPDNRLKTYSFDVVLKESSYKNYYTKLVNGELLIVCPIDTDFNSSFVQKTIWTIVEKYLRAEAKRTLPDKVELFANRYGFTYTDVKINKSISRWGSCSSRKNINLSYRCMLLPEYLIDFVILHELCHTIEMNHGEKFWQLLEKVTGDKAKELTKELRNFKPCFV